MFFFFSSRRRHTRWTGDWSSDVCSSDLASDDEFRGFGLGVRSPREKVDGLEEAVRVIRGMWTTPGFTFEGRLYRTDGAQLEPRPDRRIPIWLGTFGDRALNVTGRLADGWIP